MAAMSLFRHLPRPRPYICQRCIRKQRDLPRPPQRTIQAAAYQQQESQWKKRADGIKAGAYKSMLTTLEDRGFVKDIAGGREALDWLLTEKPIGAYVGVDPTAPSLHVGHLLPLMVLYWMHLHGYYTVTLLGGGTVMIGDPSGRTTARARQTEHIQEMNRVSMRRQLKQLWNNVRALGVKHEYKSHIIRGENFMNNHTWLKKLNAIELMQTLGSGMRLGTMLNRDSVKMRMENGDGMAVSEFCYPLFQGYDWWHMYSTKGVQMQIGGSDQYGNICAGMDAVDHMRKYRNEPGQTSNDVLNSPFGLTTPLLTTASGEKFGKSAGNAIWLDDTMLSSFDLYQYFLRTADDDVERYLKLFTFIPLDHIELVMAEQERDASKRVAQHILAKQVVELAHGAEAAKKAENAHKEAFVHGTNFYSISVLRENLRQDEESDHTEKRNVKVDKVIAYKKAYTAPAVAESNTKVDTSNRPDTMTKISFLPSALLRKGTFPHILYAAGLVNSKSEAHRLIKNGGAYVVLPNSGTLENPGGLKWAQIPASVSDVDPSQYLVDFKALVLRVGKTNIKICRVMATAEFEEKGLSFPGWEDFKSKEASETGASLSVNALAEPKDSTMS